MKELEKAIRKREETLIRYLCILQGYIIKTQHDADIAENMRDYWEHLGVAD